MEAGVRGKYSLFGVLALVSAVLDQATKFWASDHLPAFGRAGMSLLGQKLVLLYAENPGIAFSQLQGIRGGRVVLSLVSLVALVLVARYLRHTPSSRSAMIAALGLICGGALGNVIDRVWRGKVIDFVKVDLGFWPLNPWPVFNVADAALVVGAMLMAIALWRTRAAAAS